MDGFPNGRRRWVGVALLGTLLTVLLVGFGMGTSANGESAGEEPGHGVVVLAVATPPAAGLAQPPGAPDLPLADVEPTPPCDDAPTAKRHDDADPPRPPAHRQPAAGRAPPA